MSAVALSGIGIVLAIATLVILAYKRVHLVIVGLAASAVCAVFSGMNIYTALSTTYMSGFTGFFGSYFLLFIASATLGNVYQVTGGARAIGLKLGQLFGPKRALLAIVVSTAIMTYGGISCFVIVFAVYPVALVLLEQADITPKLSAGAIAAGCWTFAMTGPASTQVHNIIPISYLGTTSTAGGVVGVVAAVATFVMVVLYLNWQNKKYKAKGEGFAFPAHVTRQNDSAPLPSFLLALLPLIFLLVIFNVFKINIVLCMYATLALSLILMFKFIPKGKIMETITEGLSSGTMVLINMAAIIAFGSISKATPFYAWAVETVLSANVNPYVLVFTSTNIFSGLLGSASGGIGLTFSSLGETFRAYGDMGYNLGYIHRLASIACGGLDSLPYCGGVVSMLAVCGLNHKDGYKHIGWTCTIIPLIVGGLIALPLCMLLG